MRPLYDTREYQLQDRYRRYVNAALSANWLRKERAEKRRGRRLSRGEIERGLRERDAC